MLLGVLGSSCGADTRSFALALVTHETARPMAIARPIPPINLRVDVRLPRPAARAHAPVARVDDAAASERYREWSLDELADAMSTRSVRRVLGNYRSTSPIYRLELEGGVQVGFKPAIPGQSTWWRHDVVAYRLARVLGIADRVPPAIARRVRVDQLEGIASRDGLITTPDDHEAVAGVAIFWLPVLRATFLGGPSHRAQWQPWLDARGPMPVGADAVRAAEISSVIVFDYLQANEDRWNDANIRADENDHLVYRDNNVGWFPEKMEDLTWGEETLRGAQRFSRALVSAIERATPEALRDEVARAGDAGYRLIDERTLTAYGARRHVVMRYIARMRERFGDETVLPWP